MTISALSSSMGSVQYQPQANQAAAAKVDSPNDGDADDIKVQTQQAAQISSPRANGRIDITA